MANTYIQIIIHAVFAVKHRSAQLEPVWRPVIHRYIARCLNERGHTCFAVGGIDDHVHVLFSYSAKEPLEYIMRDIKRFSSRYINDQRLAGCRFEWQRGYAAISVSRSHVEVVKSYILEQPEHHKGISLRDEIVRMLQKAGIEFDEKYIFTEPQE